MNEIKETAHGKVWYLDSVRETVNLQFLHLENYAKLIVTLASTILALSILVVRMVGSTTKVDPSVITDLEFSYGAFVLAILLGVFSFLLVSSAINKHLRHYGYYYTAEGEKYYAKMVACTRFIKWINVLAGLSFVAAIASLIFCLLRAFL